MRLILLRHGQSLHSQRNLIASADACPGLTAVGLRQVAAAADRLAAALPEGAIVLSSPALRARQTAAALVERGLAAEITLSAALCEIATGAAEGLTWDEYRATHGAFDLTAEPDRPFAPGGESWRAFVERVGAALEGWAREYAGRPVVAATHAGLIVASLLVIFGIPRPGTGARFEPAHAGLTEWRASGGLWELARFNDTAHLD